MSQYINLLGPAFRKQRQVLTLNRAALLVGFTLVLMLIVRAYESHRVDGLGEELVSAQGLLKAQNAYTSRLKGDGAQQGNTMLDNEIQRLEADLKSARDSMAMLEGGSLGNREGFARYMQAFSRQAVDGLWLTGFSVSGVDVSIQGRVVKPELIPTYIQRLNGEPALKGRAFAALDLHRPAPRPSDGVPAKDAVPEKAETPRFLEFALATTEQAAEAVPPAGGNR